ncbi:MAG: sulfotransferase [Bacteroidota bacterium]
MSLPQLAGVAWWPHSGGRWFCRSIINQHPEVMGATFVHPWLFISTDMTMEMDITAQVHKARSLPDLKQHLIALKNSIDHGRIQGLAKYFAHIQTHYLEEGSAQTHLVGEMCLGSPIPRAIDLEALYTAHPSYRLIHLVRSPLDSYPSFAVRHEMDSDPVKIAGSWLTLNAHIRTFFETHPEKQHLCLTVRYEDLMQEPEPIARNVCEFLELEFHPDMLAKLGQRWGRNTKPEYPAEMYELMKQVASSELEKYGYI